MAEMRFWMPLLVAALLIPGASARSADVEVDVLTGSTILCSAANSALLRESVHFTFDGSCEGSCSRNWSFGDGASSTEESPTHSYLSPGTFSVQLNLNNESDNASAAADLEIETCWTPTGAILQNGECYGTAIELSAPVAALYQWSTGAETPSISTSLPGLYSVDLAQNASGCWAQLQIDPYFHQCNGQPAGNVDMDPEGRVDAEDAAALLKEIGDGDGIEVMDSGGGDLGAPGADLGDGNGGPPDTRITQDDILSLLQLIFSTS